MNIKAGSNLSKVRKNNYAAILGTIYQQGPVLRSEIAKQLGVTLPTVTTTVKHLLEEGILKEVPVQETGTVMGRRAAAVDFVEHAGYAVGIEWSPVGVVACMTNLRGRVVAKKRAFADLRTVTYEDMLKATKSCVEELIREAGIDKARVIGAGWATPGMVEPETGILIRSSMDGVSWRQCSVQKDLESVLGIPVCIENHVRVRAIGRDMFDRADRPEVYLYYFAQMGVSCCVMEGGEPFGTGRTGIGDIGHTVMAIDGPECTCGKRGCLQAFVGEMAILMEVEDLLRNKRAGVLRKICTDPERPEIMEVVRAVECGDEDVKAVVLPAVRYMGISIGNIVNLLNSQLVVIDCALFDSPLLRDYLNEIIYESNIFKRELELRTEYVSSNRYTGAQGGCALAIREFMIGRSVEGTLCAGNGNSIRQ